MENQESTIILSGDVSDSTPAVINVDPVADVVADKVTQDLEQALVDAVHQNAIEQAIVHVSTNEGEVVVHPPAPEEVRPIVAEAVENSGMREAVRQAVTEAVNDVKIPEPKPNSDLFLSNLELYAKAMEQVDRCNADLSSLQRKKDSLEAEVKAKEQQMEDMGMKEVEMLKLRRANEELSGDNDKLVARTKEMGETIQNLETHRDNQNVELAGLKVRLAEAEEGFAREKAERALEVQSLRATNQTLLSQIQTLVKSCRATKAHLEVFTGTSKPDRSIDSAMRETQMAIDSSSQYAGTPSAIGQLLAKKFGSKQ
jgi:predicted  nucleic acid-binding Zn-ribbon protein